MPVPIIVCKTFDFTTSFLYISFDGVFHYKYTCNLFCNAILIGLSGCSVDGINPIDNVLSTLWTRNTIRVASAIANMTKSLLKHHVRFIDSNSRRSAPAISLYQKKKIKNNFFCLDFKFNVYISDWYLFVSLVSGELSSVVFFFPHLFLLLALNDAEV